VFEEKRKKGKGFILWKHAPYSFSMNNYILTKNPTGFLDSAEELKFIRHKTHPHFLLGQPSTAPGGHLEEIQAFH